MDLKNWMSRIDGSLPLLALNLPATHNSAAKKAAFSLRTKCQCLGIYEQLCIGVRSLDIRVAPKNGGLGIVHSFAKVYGDDGAPMDLREVLAQCCRFLEEHPREAIVLQFKNDDNRYQKECARYLEQRYIAEKKEKWYLGKTVPTLDEARGKIVLVRRCEAAHPIGIDFSRWREQDKREPQPLMLHAGEERFLIQDRYTYPPKGKWEQVLLPQLQRAAPFDGTYHYHYTSTAGSLKGPRHAAAYINEKLMAFPFEKGKYYGTVYFDFITEPLAKKIVETNE